MMNVLVIVNILLNDDALDSVYIKALIICKKAKQWTELAGHDAKE